MNITEFAEGTERMIDPMQVGSTHHVQKKLRKLPVCLQRRIVTAATKKADKMGFVVEPYAFFLFYEIADVAKVQRYLPIGFAPAKARVFVGDEPRYYGIASMFRVHTSAFWGARAEFYAIAENTATGLLSWVILDYVSDTISYDVQHGLRSPEAPGAVLTTTCEGMLLAEMKSEVGRKRLVCKADLNRHKMRKLDEVLWIEGNTSIVYSREVGGDAGSLFSLTFLPREMKEAWEIPLADVKEARVDWFPAVFGGKVAQAACFPFAQHMLSDSPGNSTHYGSKIALEEAAERVRFGRLKGFS